MKIRLGLLAGVLLLVSSTALPEIEKVAQQCGNGVCYAWWPKLAPAKGWHHEDGSSFANGANVQVPDGFTFSNAETVIYAKACLGLAGPAVPPETGADEGVAGWDSQEQMLIASRGYSMNQIQLIMAGVYQAPAIPPPQNTAAGRQPDGSYRALTGPGSEIAKIEAAANSGKPVPLVGDGECVALTSKLTHVPDNTRLWTAGQPVVLPDGTLNPDVKPGTAVATFDAKGNYPRGNVPKNSGAFLGPAVASGKGSISLMDQWKAHPPNPANQPQSRDVRFYSDPTVNVSNNSNAYYVILVPR